jgi:hypothetical protein
MTQWSAPSKTEQEQEAAANSQANGADPNAPVDTAPVTIEDNSSLEQKAQPAPPAENDNAPEEKPEPKPFVDPRKEMAERFRKKRQEERDQYVAHTDPSTALPLSMQPTEAPANDDNTAAPAVNDNTGIVPPAADKTFEVKVNGQTAKVSRDQLLAMADLTAEDAEGLPEATLIKSAQITEAARRRLADAKATPFGAPPAPAAPAATPAANTEPNAEPQSQPSAPRATPAAIKEAIEKMQYGDPEEASAAFVDALDARLDQRSYEQRENVVLQDQNNAIEAFGKKNPDLYANDEASEYLLTRTTTEVINDLRKLGAPEENLIPLRTNPNLAYQAHREARVAGLNVRTPTDILEAAGTAARKLFAIPNGTSQPSAAPASTPANDRLAAKRALIQQPQRSGNQVAAEAPTPQRTRSAVVQRMRAARGQPVA